MTDKDRLIELICESIQTDECIAHCNHPYCQQCDIIADHLIANGVTVGKDTNVPTEWISVEERLPERNGRYLTHCNVEGQSLVCILYCCNVDGFNESEVTHWMSLPQPPKEVDNGK